MHLRRYAGVIKRCEGLEKVSLGLFVVGMGLEGQGSEGRRGDERRRYCCG